MSDPPRPLRHGIRARARSQRWASARLAFGGQRTSPAQDGGRVCRVGEGEGRDEPRRLPEDQIGQPGPRSDLGDGSAGAGGRSKRVRARVINGGAGWPARSVSELEQISLPAEAAAPLSTSNQSNCSPRPPGSPNVRYFIENCDVAVDYGGPRLLKLSEHVFRVFLASLDEEVGDLLLTHLSRRVDQTDVPWEKDAVVNRQFATVVLGMIP